MASQGYYDWLKAGKPYTLIRPAKAVQGKLRARGLTVYDYPNDAHLKAATPEDHTPFSVTGWPGTNKRWNARALDIMPRSASYEHRKENADIARKLIQDRDAQVPGAMWIKYLNWTDEAGNCRQEYWKDTRGSRSSTDKGHVHVSGRSDCDNDTRADNYDPYPIAGLESPDMTQEERDMLSRCERILTALCTRLMVTPGAGETADRTGIKLEPTWANGPAVVPNPISWMIGQFGGLAMAGIDTAALADDIASKVIAADTNALTDADKPVITAAVQDALRLGTE